MENKEGYVREKKSKKLTPIKQQRIIASRKGVNYSLTTMSGTVVDAPLILAGWINQEFNSLRPILESKGWVFKEE